MMPAAAAPLPVSVPVPGSAPRAADQGEQVTGAGLPLSSPDTAEASADDFLLLLAALMQQPVTPPAPVAVAPETPPDAAMDGASAVDASAPSLLSTAEGSAGAVALDVTFSVAARFRPAPPTDAPRQGGPVSAQIGATMRQLFPGQTAPGVPAPRATPMVTPAATEKPSAVGPSPAPIAVAASDAVDVPLSAGQREVVAMGVPVAPETASSDGEPAVGSDTPAALFDEMIAPDAVIRSAHGVSGAVRHEAMGAPTVTPATPVAVAIASADRGVAEVEGERVTVVVESAQEPSGTRPTGRRASDGGMPIAETAIAAMRPSGEGASRNHRESGDGEAATSRRDTDAVDAGEATVMPARDQVAASGTSSLLLAASTMATAAPARPAFVPSGPAEAPSGPRQETAIPEPRGDQATVLLDTADGTDRIRVSVRGSTVHATILTESSHHEALASRVEDLRRSLGERGFTDARVAVRMAPGHVESAPSPVAGGVAAPEARVTTSGRGEGRAHDDPTAHQRQHPDDTTEQRGRRRHPEEETE